MARDCTRHPGRARGACSANVSHHRSQRCGAGTRRRHPQRSPDMSAQGVIRRRAQHCKEALPGWESGLPCLEFPGGDQGGNRALGLKTLSIWGRQNAGGQQADRSLKPSLETVKGSGFEKLRTESQWVKRKQSAQIHFREHFVDADV